MSNSFNISFKPEISALETKVDTVDTVVDSIRATDVPNIQTNIDANETKIDLIRGTDVPNIQTNIDANETKIDLIRGTDVPNIQTNIDANETKIDAIPPYPGFGVLPSDTIIISLDTIQLCLSTTYVSVKEFLINISSTYRISFEFRTQSASYIAYARIYKNSSPFGTEHTTNSESYVTKTEDLVFSTDDVVELMIKNQNVSWRTYVQNLRVKGTVVTTASTVITD